MPNINICRISNEQAETDGQTDGTDYNVSDLYFFKVWIYYLSKLVLLNILVFEKD